MLIQTRRLFLGGLALGPALASVMVPFSQTMPGLGALIAIAASLSVGVVSLWIRDQTVDPAVKLLHIRFLSPSRLERLDEPQMRRDLDDLITRKIRDKRPMSPPDRKAATGQVLRRFFARLNVDAADDLGRPELLALHTLSRILMETPENAGRLAQRFLRPEVVLELRDEVDQMDAAYQSYQTGHNAYLAAQRQWKRLQQGQSAGSILKAIQSLDTPDIDLWHRIVLEHDPYDHEQRNAALWCMQQPQCDRGTIAVYMSYIAADGSLLAAARIGDRAYLEHVRRILTAWNNGEYRTQEIALDPVNAVEGHARVMTKALDDLQRITGERRWADPHGMFVAYKGRPARLRLEWQLSTGEVLLEPYILDYVEGEAIHI